MLRFHAFAVTALLLGATTASAQTPTSLPDGPAGEYGVGLNVSTLGIGAEGGYRFDDHFGVRIGANGFTYSFNKTFDSTPYSVDAHLASGGGLIDYYPFES